MAKPLILVTNDDGINAPGIRTLISVIKDIGDITVSIAIPKILEILIPIYHSHILISVG